MAQMQLESTVRPDRPVSIGCGKHQKTSTDSVIVKPNAVCAIDEKAMRSTRWAQSICKKYESIDGCSADIVGGCCGTTPNLLKH